VHTTEEIHVNCFQSRHQCVDKIDNLILTNTSIFGNISKFNGYCYMLCRLQSHFIPDCVLLGL